MYISAEIADRIKNQAKKHGFSVRQMLIDLGLGQNSMSNFKTSMPKADTIARIADYLNCSVDYLLGRTDIVSYKPAPASGELTEHERLVLEAYRSNTAMQSAVDKLLGIDEGTSENIHIVKIAARNGGGIREVALTDSDIEKIKNLPDINSDDDL